MTKHTPGPWVATGFEGIVVNDSLGRTLALAPGSSTNIPEMSANARLIAAAPDLLDMCERLLGFAHHYASPSALSAGDGMLASAKALIAQAKGEC
jgi:hypothetical protein